MSPSVFILAPSANLAIWSEGGVDVAHREHGLPKQMLKRVLLQILVHIPARADICVQRLVGSHDASPGLDVLEVLRVELVLALLVDHDGRSGARLRTRLLQRLQKVFRKRFVHRSEDAVGDVFAMGDADGVGA